MSISDLGSVANIVSAIAILAALVYFARQVRQSNLLARAQARQRLVDQTNEALHQWMSDPELRSCFVKDELSGDEQSKLHYFLLAAMRRREAEWFQFQEGVLDLDMYQAYQQVIGLHLGIPRTRRWWSTVGRVGFDSHFVATVDALLASRKRPVTYFEDITRYDAQRPEADRSFPFPREAARSAIR